MEYHTYTDVDWIAWSGESVRQQHGDRGKMRVHRFLTGRETGGIKPIFGFTAFVILALLFFHSIFHYRVFVAAVPFYYG
jgi:coenzyme A diphosphatase NUDT7